MNYLLGPLIERIVVLYAVGGRDPLPEDVKVAAEWNYRIWRYSGRATEIELPDMPVKKRRRGVIEAFFDAFLGG